ncbi:TetR/AcrR family transcriptional regulator C-terminal domain-containing protein [Streptomyces sp. NPDC001537]
MQIALHTQEAFLRPPRVGALAAARTARRENEFRSVERKLDCMRRAGLDDADAARYYRVFADLVLAYSAMDASLAAPANTPTSRGQPWLTDGHPLWAGWLRLGVSTGNARGASITTELRRCVSEVRIS